MYFVTGNEHKFFEISEAFEQAKVGYEVTQLDQPTLEIQANKLEEVARFKLESVKKNVNKSVFIEDAGFFVDEPLKGFPGVYSSYVFKTLGNKAIIRLIDDFDSSKARFVSIIALYFEPHKKVYTFKGEVKGRVSAQIKGKEGFGFDPIFIPSKQPNKTFAELSRAEKTEISHRGNALRKLIEFLNTSSD